ncbi:MAG: hypothetical protein RL687_440 [Candidatus Parcubacteria bacterium]|jgi:hypothetical protein
MFIFNIKKQNKNITHSQKGYAILYTVVIISIIMTISIGLSNAVNKQLILSSVARDSQSAFYQADTAIECALLIQFTYAPYVTDDNFDCGLKTDGTGITLTAIEDSASPGVFRIKDDSITSGPCFEIYVDERTPSPNKLIRASGYNECNPTSPKRVERSFEVRY